MSPDAWPTDVDALARIAGNEGEPEDRRNRAWTELIPLIERGARGVSRADSEGIAQEIQSDAVGYVFGRIRYFVDRPPDQPIKFRPWLNCELRRLRWETHRKNSRGRPGSMLEEPTDPRQPGRNNEAAEELECRLRQLRQILDRAEGQLENENRVDYFALLLLHLRLGLVKRLIAAREPGPVVGRVEEMLPWREPERGRGFGRGGCTLAAVWHGLLADLSAAPPLPVDARICECINQLQPPPANKLTVEAWRIWLCRLRRGPQLGISADDWGRCIAPIIA